MADAQTMQQARSALYRSRIIDAAEQVIARDGFAGAKMQAIAKEADVALGTLYRVFRGKQDIVDALHRARGAELVAYASERAGLGQLDTSDPEAALSAGVAAYLRYLLDHPEYLRVQLASGHAWAFGSGYVSEEQTRQFALGMKLVASVFERGIAAGRVVDMDPMLMARLMVAQHQVLLVDFLERAEAIPAGQRPAAVDALIARADAQMKRAFFVRRP